MELTNDQKAVDNEYKSPINFLNSNRQLGRTNKQIVIELKRLYRKESELIEITDDTLFKKEYTQWESDLNGILKQIITPWTKSDIKDIEIEDIEDILKEISRRSKRRRGLTDSEIEEIEEADRQAMLLAARNINRGNLDFLNQNRNME